MRTGDLNIISKLSADILDKHEQNALLNAFRIAVNGSLTQFNMVDGIVDEYEDESGISHVATPFAHMAMEDNADDGTGANAVTTIGTPTYTSGKLNNALTLDGSTDALNINALMTDIVGDTIGSFAFWLNPNDTSGNEEIINFGDTNGVPYVNFFKENSTFRIVLSKDGTNSSKWDVSGGIESGWHHWVIVQNATALVIYKDRVDVTPTPTLTGDGATGNWLSYLPNLDNGRLGCGNFNNSGNVEFFNGQIDDFRYYQNKALTSEEVSLLYNSGTGTEDSEIGSQSISYNSTDDYYSPSEPQVSVSPYMHYKLNDNLATTNVIDTGTGANNGTASTNTNNLTATGKINNAFDFTVANSYNVDTTGVGAGMASDTRGSFCLWMKSHTGALAYTLQSFTSTVTSPNDVIVFRHDWLGGTYSIGAYCSIAGATNWNVYADTAVLPDTWTHVAYVHDGTAIKIYINGVESTLSDISSPTDRTSWFADMSNVSRSALAVRVLGAGASDSNGWGIQDDMRWYSNYALSADEVLAIYNSGTGTEDDKPVGDAENMTLISNTFTAEAQPDSARIVLFEEDVDILTLNQDLLAYISRDGGTTYTQATLTDIGNYDATGQILAGEVDLSSQPAGTDMKYKIVSANNKDFKLHGTGKLWD